MDSIFPFCFLWLII